MDPAERLRAGAKARRGCVPADHGRAHGSLPDQPETRSGKRSVGMRNVRAAWLLAAAAMLAGAPATAQTARPVLDYASAAAIRDGCIAWAGERDLKLAVAIYDEAGRLI